MKKARHAEAVYRHVYQSYESLLHMCMIPAGVGLMSSWGTLKPVLVPVSVITVVVIITVMLASGWVSQLIIRRDKKKETENE